MDLLTTIGTALMTKQLEQKLSRVYDILHRDYDRLQLLDMVMELIPESELDAIIAEEDAA
jgi:hypothetical protein